MSYMPPQMVRSPKNMVHDLEILIDSGEDGWSMAKMKWGEKKPSENIHPKEAIGVRYNGNESYVGNPQARGIPMWFILPESLAKVAKKSLPEFIKELEKAKKKNEE